MLSVAYDDVTPLVAARGLTKRFGATLALDEVDLDVRPGRVLALLGANGAGKSTVIKILAGIHHADGGSVDVVGHPLGSPEANRSLAFLHQDLGLVAELSIAENVALGTGFPRSRGLVSWKAVRTQAERALALVGAELDPRTLISELSRTERSLVAIGRALAVDAEVLVLDEPTASLPVDETGRLFRVLRELRSRGLGMIYVSHRLDEVFAIADDVVVLRDGRVVGQGEVGEVPPEEIIRLIVGREPEALADYVSHATAERALELDEVVAERVGPVSLTVARGEVVGLVGLAGAGMEEIGRVVAGAAPLRGGRVIVAGTQLSGGGVKGALEAGVAFVTSNRMEEGLGPNLTVAENLLPNPRVRGSGPFSPVLHRQESALAEELVHTYGIAPADPDLQITALSGGNQQKVILGRWLSTDAKLLVLEEPTAGVDIGAKQDVYALLGQALAAGLGVVLVSTDVEEVTQVCSRALVFRDGLITDELARADLSVERLTALSTGAVAAA